MSNKIFSKRDVYIEIAERYEKYITLGVIKSGERLPSVRMAAAELKVNPNTVQRAYTLLEERGFIKTMPKKGVFVTYEGDVEKREESLSALGTELMRLKDAGVSMDRIISAVEEVYKK